MDQWTEIQKITVADADGLALGRSVRISGKKMIVGSSAFNGSGVQTGAAYIFNYESTTDKWIEAAKLLPSDGVSGNGFSSSVAVSGDTAFIGDLGNEAVYVYIYSNTNDTWNEKLKIQEESSSRFGSSISSHQNYLVVGKVENDFSVTGPQQEAVVPK
jgi:hypothetical protein